MVTEVLVQNRRSSSHFFRFLIFAVCLSAMLVGKITSASAQDQSQNPPPSSDNGKPKQDAPADAGGPGGDIGPYTIPKKKTEEDAPPPPQPIAPKRVEGMPDYSI